MTWGHHLGGGFLLHPHISLGVLPLTDDDDSEPGSQGVGRDEGLDLGFDLKSSQGAKMSRVAWSAVTRKKTCSWSTLRTNLKAKHLIVAAIFVPSIFSATGSETTAEAATGSA